MIMKTVRSIIYLSLEQIPHDFLEHFAKLLRRFLRHRLEIGPVTKIWIDRDTPNLFEWIITSYLTYQIVYPIPKLIQ